MARDSSIRRTALECLWPAGLLILLLQGAIAAIPAGETRDWAMYYMVGGWAAALLGGECALRFFSPRPYAVARYAKAALAVYAVAGLSMVFLLPFVTIWLSWLWVLAVLVARAWLNALAVKGMKARLSWGAGMVWFLMTAAAMCGSLLYKSPWLSMTQTNDNALYIITLIVFLLFTCPVVYIALTKAYQPAAQLKAAWRVLWHVCAVYLLALLLWRTDYLAGASAMHHWKAYLEPAASVRSGGWPLWDVPNIYGLLQTLALAAMPARTTWQSLYLLNGGLLVTAGYMIFYTLGKIHRSATGQFFCLLIALSGMILVLPGTPDPRLYPSTSAMRFFWVYVMTGYVFMLNRSFAANARIPFLAYVCGHALAVTGVLWSIENAVYMIAIWIPSAILLVLAQCLTAARPAPAMVAKRLGAVIASFALMVAAVYLCMALVYNFKLGHAPDMPMMTAYARSFTYNYTYALLPILQLKALPCWLCIFAMMTLTCRSYIAHAAINSAMLGNLAVFWAIISALWIVSSYYVPFSEDYHLTGTLPLLIYLSAMLLRLLSPLAVPGVVKTAYRKILLCLYCVLLTGTLSHIDPGSFASVAWLAPISGDVTRQLADAPPSIKLLALEAGIAPNASVMVLSQPYVTRGADHYLSLEEGLYFKGWNLQPWLLPNSILAYNEPLPHETYELLATRRAARMNGEEGWLIEWKDNPLEQYPWIKNAIEKYYHETSRYENSECRIRHYERISR